MGLGGWVDGWTGDRRSADIYATLSPEYYITPKRVRAAMTMK